MGNAIFCCRNDEISHHQQEPMSHDHHAIAERNELPPIRLPLKGKSKQNSELNSPAMVVVGPNQSSTVDKEGKKQGVDQNDAFSDYINRAKIKIRTTTNNIDGEKIGAVQEGNVGDHKKKEENGSKDIFSDYINRAKAKIRKTSSIGSRKK